MTQVDFSSLELLGRIVTESDGSIYENEIKKAWNALLRTRRPLAFIKVKGKSDVAKAVRFCTDNKLNVTVCAGGKSEFSLIDDAVVIDLSEMCKVEVDEQNQTALVEGGAKVADVDEALYKHGFTTPLGSFSQLGVAGMTLQGGMGFLTRHYGLSSDNVLEYELITANGNAMKVSAEQNAELFWGMKGHGYNFGVVTSMRFQVYEMPQSIVGGLMLYQFSNAKEVIKKFRDYHEKENDHCLSLYILIHIGTKSPELIVRLHYSGTLRRGGEIVQDIVDLTHPYRYRCGPVEHPDFQKQGDYLIPNDMFNYSINGHMLSELKDEIIDNTVDYVKDIGVKDYRMGSTIYINGNFGGKDSESGYEESSFPFRKALRYWVGANAATENEENFEVLKKWADGFQAVNDGHGLAPYDGGNAEEAEEKLKALKQQYDPDNVFHNNLFNIDPSA